MDCPNCKHEGAYVGATTVECPNGKCRHYTRRQYDEYMGTRETEVPEEADADSPQYLWTNYHHDCGD